MDILGVIMYSLTYSNRVLFLRRFSKEKVVQKWLHTLFKNVGYEVLWVCLYEISGVFIINKSVSGCAYGTGSFFHVFSWIFSSFDRTMRVCLCVYFHN